MKVFVELKWCYHQNSRLLKLAYHSRPKARPNLHSNFLSVPLAGGVIGRPCQCVFVGTSVIWLSFSRPRTRRGRCGLNLVSTHVNVGDCALISAIATMITGIPRNVSDGQQVSLN